MKVAAAVVCLSPLLFYSPTSSAASGVSKEVAAPSPASPWLKVYSLEPYSEYWHLRLKVRRFGEAVPKIIKVLEKSGGILTVPLANAIANPSRGYQQLSFRFSKRDGGRALRKLQKMGTMEMLIQSPANSWTPTLHDEIGKKIRALDTEMSAKKQFLNGMPIISSLAHELLDHLKASESAAGIAENRLLMNLEILREDSPDNHS